uniref:DC-STAMP domain-containing protein 2-like n=1 Tax=Ciona intestinalis TaxID=7719 RepID=UPI000EF47AF4|nr:DC-STAMP domain-containing protein 2-like [Ciona intestinalis]|eukprot:XP_018669385.2 DC-STAMP domain-containing protein 2-like [Ciona intestinalis]
MSYSYEFKYDMNSSKSISDITNDILTEVKGDLKHVTSAFEWLRFAMGFSIVVVILKALKYRHKYLTVIKFDNFYITDKFIKLDKRRKRKEEIAVLPLRARENSFYVSPNRIWMSRRELKKFTKGMSLLTFGFLYTLAVIFVDYSFYWLLQKITNSLTLREQAGSLLHQAVQKGAKAAADKLGVGETGQEMAATLISLSIVGPGFVSVIYRSIASALDRLASSEGYNFAMDKCLPIAKHPDYIVYAVIISLYLLCYVICIVESYVLRSRRRIMATFHPKRERARILFLRAKILRGRGVGPDARMKNSLKKACLEAQKNAEKEKVGLADRLASYSGVIGWLARLASGRTKYRCHVCKVAGGAKHAKFFTSCERFGCKGRYCIECFEDMHRLCLLCLMKHGKKVGRERQRSKTSLTSVKSAERNEYPEEVEQLIDSSGISDSSAPSTDDDDDENSTYAETKEKISKHVHFEAKPPRESIIPVGSATESTSDSEDSTHATTSLMTSRKTKVTSQKTRNRKTRHKNQTSAGGGRKKFNFVVNSDTSSDDV